MAENKTTILVCGGRNFGAVRSYKQGTNNWRRAALEYLFALQMLDDLFGEFVSATTTVISGGATGADQIGIDWAHAMNIKYRVFHPEWQKHGKSAGPIRNQKMLDEGKPCHVIAFPGGKGTEHMMKIATQAGVQVISCPYDPSIIQLEL